MNNLDTVWVLVSAFLVFFMHAGFALLESGFGRKKNTVNILSKNVLNVALASLAFYFIGFGLMFGQGDLVGGTGFFPSFDGTDVVNTPGNLPVTAFFFFQMVFAATAATAATIVSGAVAERIKLSAYLIFAFILVLAIYPIVGHWVWGTGFLAGEGFRDFAGSTVVHSVGGWAALTGVIFLGPRIGKYTKDGKARAIPGHSMPLAAAGMFILWLGWFGFNPGSQLDANGTEIARIALTTNMAAAAGGVAACITAWMVLKAPDFSMIVNGILAGLVAITAGCADINPFGSILVGGMAGVLVVFAVLVIDKMKLDDPVGAISVHLVGGVFGTLMVGLFSTNPDVGLGLFYGGGMDLFATQLEGVAVVGVFTVGTTAAIWFVMKKTMGIRVHPEDEYIGLDIAEHKMEAYPTDSIPGRGPAATHNQDALVTSMVAAATPET